MAAKRDGLTISLMMMKYPTKNVCLEALKQNGLALRYIENQDEEISLVAVRQNSDALVFVKEQTEKVCLLAVSKQPYCIRDVRVQTEAICVEAFKREMNVLPLLKIKSAKTERVMNHHILKIEKRRRTQTDPCKYGSISEYVEMTESAYLAELRESSLMHLGS